jgi:hypothetical protein
MSTTAFVGLRRGEIINFGIAAAAALWFGARKTVPIAVLVAGIAGVAMVAYAIEPLRKTASEIAERTGTSAGLLSLDVWKQVDFAAEVESSARKSPDFSNAVHVIDYSSRWSEYTYGRQSWDRFVFHWVPAQIVGVDTKKALMFEQGSNYERIQAEYGYTRIGGTTPTGFGFAYQEFGPFGFFYFLLIGILMGRLWSRAEAGDVGAQTLYVSFAGNALHSVTHHAMFLMVQIPLFLLVTFILESMAGHRSRYRRRGRPLTLARR